MKGVVFWRSQAGAQRLPRSDTRPARRDPRDQGLGHVRQRPAQLPRPQQDELQDQRLERTWFGSGAEIKLKALSKAKELSANWN